MAIFKVTAVPDFSQLKGEIAKLQSSPVTLGVDTQQANVNIKATAKNVATVQEAFQDAGKKAQQSSEKTAEKVKSVGQAAKETSGFADLMGDSFGRVAAKMALWQVMGNAIAGLKRSFTEALATMKDVDDEMVTIRKVTGATTEELNKIEKQAYETASAYGVAADEYLNSVANFSRAGYGEQASALAELATKTQIVGDTDAETAQQFLLSMDAAYKYQGSIEQLTKVLDGANEIDNNYATSIEKIAEGLGKVAPIAAQAHVGADELTAAIGTITAVTQRSGTEAATALRALFLNIIGDTKTEIDEGVTWTTGEIAGLRDVIKVYAKDAYDAAQATGSVINPMKAIAGLAQSMKDGLLTEQQLMEMVSDIGGKLRTSQLLALIQNWDIYESMLGDYADAVGSADKEVENALDSWTRKTEILHNKWTEFISNLVETDTIKGALDQVIALVEFLDSDTGRLVIQIGLLVAALTLANKGFTALMNTGVGTFFGTLTSAIGGNAMAITQLTGQMKSLLAVLPKIGIGAAIFAALAAAIYVGTQKQREYNNALKETEEIQSKLGETQSEYDGLINKTGELTAEEKKRLEVLKELRQEQEKQLDAAQKSAWEAWNAAHGSGASAVVGGAEGVGGGLGVGAVKMERMDVVALRNYREELEAIEAQYRAGELSAGAYYDALQDLNAAREDSVETIRAAIDAGYEVTEEQRQLVAAYDRVQQMLGVTQNATKDYVSKLIEEARQSGATGKALYDLVAAQIAASNTKLNFSQQIMALQQLAMQAGYAGNALANTFALAGINESNVKRTAEGLLYTGQYSSYEAAYAEALRRAQQAMLYQFGNMTSTAPSGGWGGSAGGGSSGSSGSSSSGESALRKKAQTEIDALKKARDAETAAIDEQIEALKKQNEETERGEKLEELKLNILKKQDALLNARNERTVRQYNAATGQWEWVADPSKVKQAEEDLEDAKKDLRDYEREVELDLAISELEARKKAIEAAYQIKIDAWNDYLDGLSSAVDREKDLLDESVKNNQDAADKIKDIQGPGGSGGTGSENLDKWKDTKAGDIIGNVTGGTGSTNLDKWKDTKAGDIISSVTGGSSGKSNGIPSGSTAKDILEGGQKKQTGIPSGTTAKDILSGAGSKSSGSGSKVSQRDIERTAKGLVQTGKYKNYDAALKEAKRRAGVYDSGGVLRGMGGIKATMRDEMVLPPDITAKMLQPSADARFRARVNELGGLYGETPVSRSVAGNSDNRSYSDHSGPTYNVKGITLTEQKAEHLTVAQMCRMAHNVKPYGG